MAQLTDTGPATASTAARGVRVTPLFDLDSAVGVVAELASPKDLRALLLAGLIADIEDEIARESSGIDMEKVVRIDVDPSRSHAYAWERVQGMRSILAAVKRALQTREEYLLAEVERTGQPPTPDRLECARHRDGCAHCEQAGQDIVGVQRERDHLEHIRCIYAQHICELIQGLDDPQRSLTLPQVRAALKAIRAKADREWRRRPA